MPEKVKILNRLEATNLTSKQCQGNLISQQMLGTISLSETEAEDLVKQWSEN